MENGKKRFIDTIWGRIIVFGVTPSLIIAIGTFLIGTYIDFKIWRGVTETRLSTLESGEVQPGNTTEKKELNAVKGYIGLISAPEGSNTDSGVKYDPGELYGARNENGLFKDLPYYSIVRITNLEMAIGIDARGDFIHPETEVTIVDKFPGLKCPNRILIVSNEAFRELKINKKKGVFQGEAVVTGVSTEFEEFR